MIKKMKYIQKEVGRKCINRYLVYIINYDILKLLKVLLMYLANLYLMIKNNFFKKNFKLNIN